MSDAADRFKSPPARFFHHPYTDALYGAYDGHHVRVEQGGKWGVFTRDGVWIEGPLRTADPHFARWVSGQLIIRAVFERTGQAEQWS